MISRLRTAATVALAALFASSVSSAQAPGAPAIYKDPRQPVERRVADILSRMTLRTGLAGLLVHRTSAE
jgi:beta-glucosidase